MTLGMPRLPEEWANDQVLGFFRLMWQQWLIKSRNGSQGAEDVIRGPAPPAAVAAAAKIALSSLGGKPEGLFQTEPHEKPLIERAPVEPAGTALLERTNSGTVSVPLFTVLSEVGINDFVDGEFKVSAMTNSSPPPPLSTVVNPFENPERRNANLRWLRLHFRSLSDIGRLPFQDADLWQLHQYYFSPPFFQIETCNDVSATSEVKTNTDVATSEIIRAPPPTPALTRSTRSFDGCAVSFHALGEAFAASGVISLSHGIKRSSSLSPEEVDDGPAAKKAKNLKPRIAYYPRIMVSMSMRTTKDASHHDAVTYSHYVVYFRPRSSLSERNQWSKLCHCFDSSSTPRELCLPAKSLTWKIMNAKRATNLVILTLT